MSEPRMEEIAHVYESEIAQLERERDDALEALRRVVANESNHYDRYWTPAPEPLTDEWLDATEAKMREALTDAFCDDAAAVMLTLIAWIRRARSFIADAIAALVEPAEQPTEAG